MSEIKLLPCPFCGGEAKLNERYRGGVANRKMYWVSCRKCGATQPYHSLAGYRKNVDAIGQWNTRKPMDKIVEQLEKASFTTQEYCDEDGYYDDYYSQTVVDLDTAIEIVKGGGAE